MNSVTITVTHVFSKQKLTLIPLISYITAYVHHSFTNQYYCYLLKAQQKGTLH